MKATTGTPTHRNWIECPGYEATHEVSVRGEVRRRGNRPLRLQANRKGYPVVKLQDRGRVRSVAVHRLVALAFLDADTARPQVNHKNGIRDDNRAANLEWCTCLENVHHGRLPKLTADDVREIRSAYAAGEYQSALGRRFDTTQTNISTIVNRHTWRHVA